MVQGRHPEHSREKILEKGLELFIEQGYHATGLTQILKVCQVPKGSFYNFFGSKEQFAVEIIEHYHALEFDRWQTEFDKLEGSLFERIRLLLEREVLCFKEDRDHVGCLLANFAGEVGNASEPFRLAIYNATQEVIKSIEDDLIVCQQEGDVRTDLDALTLAKLFWDGWQGALLRMKVERSTQPLTDIIELYWNTILPPQNKETADAT